MPINKQSTSSTKINNSSKDWRKCWSRMRIPIEVSTQAKESLRPLQKSCCKRTRWWPTLLRDTMRFTMRDRVSLRMSWILVKMFHIFNQLDNRGRRYWNLKATSTDIVQWALNLKISWGKTDLNSSTLTTIPSIISKKSSIGWKMRTGKSKLPWFISQTTKIAQRIWKTSCVPSCLLWRTKSIDMRKCWQILPISVTMRSLKSIDWILWWTRDKIWAIMLKGWWEWKANQVCYWLMAELRSNNNYDQLSGSRREELTREIEFLN